MKRVAINVEVRMVEADCPACGSALVDAGSGSFLLDVRRPIWCGCCGADVVLPKRFRTESGSKGGR